MFKAIVGGVVVLLISLGLLSQSDQKEQPSETREDLVQFRVKNYITKRFGVKNIDVVAYVTMHPTKNVTVIERLSPQKITARVTVIGSKNSQVPLAISPPQQSESSSFMLPGMSSLMEKPQMASSNTIPVANESEEEREQQLIEHIFYNKETKSMSFEPQVSSLSLALFLPSELINEQNKSQIYTELNQVLNYENKFKIFLMIKPIQTSLFVVQCYEFYEQIIAWIKTHVIAFVSIFVSMVLLGVFMQYIRFKMKLKLAHYDKTVLIQESPVNTGLLQSGSKLANSPLIINSSPAELVTYLTKGVSNE